MFIILTGSSGVGKNTVINEIEKRNKNFKLMPTYTTREKRPSEVEGQIYYYLSKEEFQDKIKNKELIEYELIHNNYYGSSYKLLNEYLEKDCVLMKDMGIEGAQNFSTKISSITPVVKIFLTATKKELKKRLKGRGEKQIKLRMKRYDREQSEINKFDYIIYNNDLNETCGFIKDVYSKTANEILPTKDLTKIKVKKINKYVSMLQKGKILKPIKVAVENKKVYILKGHSKYIASILTGKPIAKEIVSKAKINKLEVSFVKEWQKLIKESLSEKKSEEKK
ncbi:MAG: AAA family ATPase [Clostridiales bacterium]|nr:AAA family ATPase [Candidatus Apopatousia equi]